MNRGRRLLLAALGTSPFAHAATASDEARFGAWTRPALAVRQPGRAALLACAPAGARLVAVGERGVIVLSDDGARRWRQSKLVPTSATLTAVQFVDDRRGWAVGHGGVILVSADGGENWALQATGKQLAASAETAAHRRAAAGDTRAAALQREAALLVADGPDKPLFDLHMVDATRGAVVGAYNLFFETADGGQSWSSALDRLDNPKSQHLYALRARGDTWMIAGEQGLLLRSRDAGRSFQRLPSPYAGSWFALAVTAQGEWVLAGLRGNAYFSNDDGERWSKLDGASPASFVSAAALPDGQVLLADQAGQLFTTRGGAGLTALPAPGLPPLSQVLAVASGDLLALGFAGAILLPRKAP